MDHPRDANTDQHLDSDRLARALADHESPITGDPARRDHLLNHARAHLAGVARTAAAPSRRRFRFASLAAAAAIVLAAGIAVRITWLSPQPEPPGEMHVQRETSGPDRDDHNRDGHVDVLDAYALARASGSADTDDVTSLLGRIVQLDHPGDGPEGEGS